MRFRLTRVRKFLCLPWREKLLFVWTVVLLFAVRFGLILLPFKTLRDMLALFAGREVADDRAERSKIDRTLWALGAAGRAFPSAGTCLTQAMVGQVLLSRRGYDTEIRIGVTRDAEEEFKAHAWLEKDGQVVLGDIGSRHDRYKPFPPLRELKPLQ